MAFLFLNPNLSMTYANNVRANSVLTIFQYLKCDNHNHSERIVTLANFSKHLQRSNNIPMGGKSRPIQAILFSNMIRLSFYSIFAEPSKSKGK